MRILACDPVHKYFFIAASMKEVEEQLIPLQKDLLESYSSREHKTYYVSSKEIRDKELSDQAKIKANPFTSKTLVFSRYIHEVCDADAYIVVKPDLSELYFVPFDYFNPDRWYHNGDWYDFDKKDIASIVEVTDTPFTHQGGKKFAVKWDFTNGQAEALLANYLSNMPEWKKEGPKHVYELIMKQYRQFHFNILEVEQLFAAGGVSMPAWWWLQDAAHQRIQSDFFVKKEEPLPVLPRTKEEEHALCAAMEEEGHTSSVISERILGDYLDGYIDWDALVWLFGDDPIYTDRRFKDPVLRKRQIWLDWFLPSDAINP